VSRQAQSDAWTSSRRGGSSTRQLPRRGEQFRHLRGDFIEPSKENVGGRVDTVHQSGRIDPAGLVAAFLMDAEPAKECLAVVGFGEARFRYGQAPFADEAPGVLCRRRRACDLQEVG